MDSLIPSGECIACNMLGLNIKMKMNLMIFLQLTNLLQVLQYKLLCVLRFVLTPAPLHLLDFSTILLSW